MNKLTKKQENFFNILIKYYQEYKEYPNVGTIKKLTNYKSYNTIYKYLTILEEKKYLKLSNISKNIIYLKKSNRFNEIIEIPIINKNKSIKVELDNYSDKEEYIAFEIKDNNLNNLGITYKDIVIISNNKNYLNNKFVLCKINNKLSIYKYLKKDNYEYLINDNKNIILENSNNIIGKVILLIKKM